MSVALKIFEPAAPHSPPPPIRLTPTETRLRDEFVASFNDTRRAGWYLQIAAVDLTDELKAAGASVTDMIKRIKYVAAVPISFHYRNGYRSAQLRLKDAAERAISVAIARYFTPGGG